MVANRVTDRKKDQDRQRKPWALLLVAAGLLLFALILLYVTTPSPTILLVRVVDSETGEPLAGARVWAQARGERALPAVVTDENGVARFHNLSPHPSYQVRVQRLDYKLTYEPEVDVPAGKETAITVSLSPYAGERLFVGLDNAQIAVIDTASLLIVQTIGLPSPLQAAVRYLLLHPSLNLLYAVAGDQGYILDSQSGQVLARMAVDETIESLDLSTDGQHLVITSVSDRYASGMLSLVHLLTLDARTGDRLAYQLLTSVNLEDQLLWQPEGTDIYVLWAANRSRWKFNDTIQKRLGVYDIPVGKRHFRKTGVLSGDGRYLYTWFEFYPVDTMVLKNIEVGRVYTSTMGWGNTAALQGYYLAPAHSLLITIRTDLGIIFDKEVPFPITVLAASPTRREVYALNEELGTLYIFDPIGAELPTLLAVGAKPVAMTISADGQRLYVANYGSQTISVVHLPTAAIVETIQLPAGPRSLALR